MRLIDADDLKMSNLSICKDCLNSSEPTIYCNKCPLTDFIKTIDNAPTVDTDTCEGCPYCPPNNGIPIGVE